MDDEVALSLLEQSEWTLQKDYQGLQYQLAAIVRGHEEGFITPDVALARLRTCYDMALECNFERGRVSVQLEDLKARMQERFEQRMQSPEDAADRSIQSALEDHLDWLRPILAAPVADQEISPDQRHPQYEGDELVHRDDLEPEDHLDWLKR